MRELTLKEIYDGFFYHICTEGLEQMTLLKDEEDYKVAWNYLALCAWRTGVVIVAFVLMSNHIHLLIATRDIMQARRMARLFKQLLSTYLKIKYGMSKVMHCTDDSISLIDSVQYLRNCIAYIFRNPVSARLCVRLVDYKWSSYNSCFSSKTADADSKEVKELSFTAKRNLLRTGMDLSSCPYRVDNDGYIVLDSFVREDIVAKAFRNSGKSFLYHLGCCNDSVMEYELVFQPLMNVTDVDMHDIVTRYILMRFHGRTIPELTTSEKCSVIKHLFFNHKTTVPQLSRILGLSRDLVRKTLSQ